MKIIASINSRSWLVEMTDDEVAKAAGYSYHSSMPVSLKPEIGREIDVTEAYASATNLINGCIELDKAKEAMLKVIKTVERFQNEINPKSTVVRSKLPN